MEPIDAILRAAFLELPLPKTFFAATKRPQDDISRELAARIQGRIWTELSLLDWRLIGASPGVFREYVTPKTFVYYVPSLLFGAVSEPAFRDWAFEAVLPSNQQRKPKGVWWFGYFEAFTDRQRAAIKSFLTYQCDTLRTLDLVEEELLSAAEDLWR